MGKPVEWSTAPQAERAVRARSRLRRQFPPHGPPDGFGSREPFTTAPAIERVQLIRRQIDDRPHGVIIARHHSVALSERRPIPLAPTLSGR